jgi:hypothetical protein
MASIDAAMLMECRTLGPLFVIDGRPTQPHGWQWQWQGIRCETCMLADTQHVELRNMYVSHVPGGVGGDYKGESVVFVPHTDNIQLPSHAAFVVPYRSQPS